ncbi:MAG: hypothetical protein K5707_05555 [Clostridia bacterium]|nr:hypothetical protein [Clostridia bacterium]
MNRITTAVIFFTAVFLFPAEKKRASHFRWNFKDSSVSRSLLRQTAGILTGPAKPHRKR